MDFYRLGLMVSSLLLDSVFGTGVRAQEVKEQSKKNVLFLIVDDLRTELNCYGVKYMKTPNIDRLAAQGVMFENAYCNVPVSGASRASLFSGLRPGNTRYPKPAAYFPFIVQLSPQAILSSRTPVKSM